MAAPAFDRNKLWSIFQIVDRDRSGAIDSSELQAALRNGSWAPFNPETVRLMISMFDYNNNGTIDFNEFCGLWQYVTDWTNTFRNYDLDKNGSIDHRELSQAYRVSRESWNTGNNFHGKLSDVSNGELPFDIPVRQKFVKKSPPMLGFGFRISERIISILLKRFDRTGCGQIRFDDFIQLCVVVRTLTNSFQRHDHTRTGNIEVTYEQFLTMVFSVKAK